MRSAVPADTPSDIFAAQVRRWQSMTPAEKGELIDVMSTEVDDIARAGIRFREPNVAPEREHWLIVARRYGRTFAQTCIGPEPIRCP